MNRQSIVGPQICQPIRPFDQTDRLIKSILKPQFDDFQCSRQAIEIGMPNFNAAVRVGLDQRVGWRWHILVLAGGRQSTLDDGTRKVGFPGADVALQKNRVTRAELHRDRLGQIRGFSRVAHD